MRRRLLASTLLVALVAVLALGLPLTLVGTRLIRDEAQARLDRDAQSLLLAVQDQLATGDRVDLERLDRLRPEGRRVEVSDPAEHRLAVGPVPTGATMSSTVTSARGERVRVLAAYRPVRNREISASLVVLALAALSAAVAVGLAVVQARRLSEPLVDLALSAGRLGAGDFRPHRRYGVPELDRVADVLDASAAQIGDLIRREREFASDASHQLRSPLTALHIRLEEILARATAVGVREEAQAALAQTERLTGVIESLLARARDHRAAAVVPLDVGRALQEREREWLPAYRRAGRELSLRSEPGQVAMATPTNLAQVLDVLLDNALAHGAGAVAVVSRTTREHVVIEVSDQGRGIPESLVSRIFERAVSGRPSGTGLGLALAQALVEADGGRLRLLACAPPVFAVFLPRDPDQRP